MSELVKEYMEEEAKPVRERFEVDNDFQAEWCLSKIRSARAKQKKQRDELTRQMEFYVNEIARVDHEAEEEVAFFTSLLAPYFRNRATDGFTEVQKTQEYYKLPTGKLVLKHREPTFEYKKEADKACDFLRKNDELKKFIKVKEEVKWGELKKLTEISGNTVVIKGTGEVIPGINVTPNEDEFVVEVE